MATAFATPGNNVSTTIGSGGYSHTTTPKVINLATGGGAKFPALPSPNTYNWYYRVTVCQVAFAYSPTASTSNYTVFSATGITGDQLTGVTLSTTEPDTQIDRDYSVGDIVEVRVTAGTLSDVQKAVNALEAGGGGGMSIGGTVTSGTNNSLLYVNGSGHLADSGPTWDGNTLTVNGPASDVYIVSINVNSNSSHVLAFNRSSTSQQLLASFGGAGTPSDPVWQVGVGAGNSNFAFGSWDSTNGFIAYLGLVVGTGSQFGSTGFFTVRPNGTVVPVTMANASAANNSLFIDSSVSNQLCWKDGSGGLHHLT